MPSFGNVRGVCARTLEHKTSAQKSFNGQWEFTQPEWGPTLVFVNEPLGMARLSVPQTNKLAFYRVLPQFSGLNPILFSGSREGHKFTFQFYAPVATNYTVDRALNLAQPVNTSTWQSVKTVAAGASNIVTVVDDTASAASGYYRVRY